MKKLLLKVLLTMLFLNLPFNLGTCKVLKATISESSGIVGMEMIIGKEPAPIIDKVFPGGACAKAGMKPGDKIISIDNKSTYGLSINEVDSAISNVPGTKILFKVIRNSQTINFSVIVQPLHEVSQQLQVYFVNN